MNNPRIVICIWAVCFCFAAKSEAEPITNAVPITTNYLFQLDKNGGIVTNEFSADEMIHFSIVRVSTNEVFYRTFPDNQSFAFRLLDAAGLEVPKTQAGLDFSKPVQMPTSTGEAADLKPHMSSKIGYNLFRPSDVFKIAKPGSYELEVRIRVWAQSTNNGTNLEALATNPKFIKRGLVQGTNAHFGVVTSEPVRVKINKK